MQDFRKLQVWEKAHLLVLAVYPATARFPASERFGLQNQLRRAAVSIPSNLAEGCGRDGDRDFGRFVQMAMGSACELDYQLLLAHELGMLEATAYADLNSKVTEVKRMLSSLLRRLGRTQRPIDG